jgi:hypothetical protein
LEDSFLEKVTWILENCWNQSGGIAGKEFGSNMPTLIPAFLKYQCNKVVIGLKFGSLKSHKLACIFHG